MLQVVVHDSLLPERRYAVDVVLGHFLGLTHELSTTGVRGVTELRAEGRSLTMPDVLFADDRDHWPDGATAPREPLPTIDLSDVPGVEPALPLLFGGPASGASPMELTETRGRLELDVFGSVFFLLTRLEEVLAGSAVRDEHDRFPAQASILHRAGAMRRPIADEYVELLWHCLQRLWPGLQRRRRRYRFHLSHDVDRPFQQRVGALAHARRCVSELRRTGHVGLPLRRLLAYPHLLGRVPPFDPFDTFDWIMDQSERHGIQSAFYFLTLKSDDPLEADYDLRHPFARDLMKRAHGRGHEIGLHTSYQTHLEPARVAAEADQLRRAAAQLGVRQTQWGGRQHYLRWHNPTTWQAWEDAGLAYDGSLGYTRTPGFRCGTAHEYPVFNLESREALSLVERPLTVMDHAASSAAPGELEEIVTRVRAAGGAMSLLWHNSHLETEDARRRYLELLELCA
ncbi:MAG: polysaccharide deacetylase family protein [Myxococcales bacterium]|jgi:hypothetical protein